MGITEKSENCICIVVSEETGSITLAQRGNLNRPLTSSKLKELLEAEYAPPTERESVTPKLSRLSRSLSNQSWGILRRLRWLPSSSTAQNDKK
jgi:hypothetical protein